MRNLISRNQLDEWRHFENTVDDIMLDEYYECLIECSDNQTICKRICRDLLQD